MPSSAEGQEPGDPWTHDFVERYLLGEATPEECVSLEERYMHEDAALDLILSVEGELIDAYVNGTLASSARRQFESHFLVTDRRRSRLEFARAMRARDGMAPRASTTVATVAHRRIPRLALRLAAAFAAVAVASWIGYDRFRDPEVSDRVVATYVLEHAQTRSAGHVEGFLLPKERGWVEVHLALRAGPEFPRAEPSLLFGYASYQVRLEDRNGERLWTSEPVTRSRGVDGGWIVVARLPSDRLAGGEYVLFLTGLTPAGGAETFEQYRLPLQTR